MSDKLYEAVERFSIQTCDGHLDDVAAIKSVEKLFGREIALEVWKICGGRKNV